MASRRSCSASSRRRRRGRGAAAGGRVSKTADVLVERPVASRPATRVEHGVDPLHAGARPARPARGCRSAPALSGSQVPRSWRRGYRPTAVASGSRPARSMSATAPAASQVRPARRPRPPATSRRRTRRRSPQPSVRDRGPPAAGGPPVVVRLRRAVRRRSRPPRSRTGTSDAARRGGDQLRQAGHARHHQQRVDPGVVRTLDVGVEPVAHHERPLAAHPSYGLVEQRALRLARHDRRRPR